MDRPGWGSIFWFLAFCGVSYLYYQSNFAPKPAWASQIMFDRKFFFDFSPNSSSSFVGASGTLTGAGMAYPNNTYAIYCYKERSECLVSSIEQIGGNQIGRLAAPASYPVKKWDAYEVVATDENPCIRTTITLARKPEAVVWVEEPINQTSVQCKNAETAIRKFTLEDSLGWQALNKATK